MLQTLMVLVIKHTILLNSYIEIDVKYTNDHESHIEIWQMIGSNDDITKQPP
jgi:hypothetical protein